MQEILPHTGWVILSIMRLVNQTQPQQCLAIKRKVQHHLLKGQGLTILRRLPLLLESATRRAGTRLSNSAKSLMAGLTAFSDKEILATQKMLTEKEGIFCEPASATSVAGALRDIKLGKIPEGSSVVCTLTGHGLKDPDTAIAQCDQSAMINVNPTLDEVKKAILDQM